MSRFQASVVLLSASVCLLLAVAASAEGRERHHHRYVRDDRHRAMTRSFSVIGRTGLGDTIVSGQTGMHRSGFGVMVPDAPGGDLDAAGRIGANGTVGLHVTGH